MGAFNLTAAGIWAVDRVYYGKRVSDIERSFRLSVVGIFTNPVSSLLRVDKFFVIVLNLLWKTGIMIL